jgi:AraC-like DNA-binding protein
MKLLYSEEHYACHLYGKEKTSPIEYITKEKGEKLEVSSLVTRIMFIMEGSFSFSSGRYIKQQVKKGSIFLLPPRFNCQMVFEEDTAIMDFHIYTKMNFCEQFPIELLYEEKHWYTDDDDEKMYLLPINKRIQDFLLLLTRILKDGLKCSYLFELKLKEVLYYLRAYYPKEELILFFAPIASNDATFSELIYEHANHVKTVHELAKITNYSLSGFKKRFQKNFGISAHEWITKQKAKKIYHEINCSRKTFTDISIEYNFSSPSHLDNFCKRVFGYSPGEIRKQNQLKTNIKYNTPKMIADKKAKKDKKSKQD